jgi:hypothetical protein
VMTKLQALLQAILTVTCRTLMDNARAPPPPATASTQVFRAVLLVYYQTLF